VTSILLISAANIRKKNNSARKYRGNLKKKIRKD